MMTAQNTKKGRVVAPKIQQPGAKGSHTRSSGDFKKVEMAAIGAMVAKNGKWAC